MVKWRGNGEMTEHNLTSELQSLLADYHRLALLCDSIRLDAYSVKVVDSFHYPVLVSYLAVEKAKVRLSLIHI